MTAITITRRLEIDAGHRIYGHESKCGHLHGHRYVFEIECRAPELDHLGRVIDFSVIKSKVGTWLDQEWDHGMLLWAEDPILQLFVKGAPLHGNKVFALGSNPTAENMAEHVLYVASDMLAEDGIEVVSVVCRETPNCRAEARG